MDTDQLLSRTFGIDLVFGQIIVSAALHGFHRIRQITVARHDDDLAALVVGSDFFQYLQAIGSGKIVVQEDAVKGRLTYLF